jgi:hypothetical protein
VKVWLCPTSRWNGADRTYWREVPFGQNYETAAGLWIAGGLGDQVVIQTLLDGSVQPVRIAHAITEYDPSTYKRKGFKLSRVEDLDCKHCGLKWFEHGANNKCLFDTTHFEANYPPQDRDHNQWSEENSPR